jgi:hypothetical protein
VKVKGFSGDRRNGAQADACGVNVHGSGEVTPTTEVCDAKDNDCDGFKISVK